MRTETRVLIMAGGTGGHVFPALAVAAKLREQGVRVEWLGTSVGIEAELVPKAGIVLNTIRIGGLRGKGIKAWALLPWNLSGAIAEAAQVLRRFAPHVVLGMGGFASGPGGLAARALGKPVVIHEQNAIAGTTNRWLARIARRRLEAFPGSLPRAEQVGNPVRDEIVALPAPEQRYPSRSGRLRLLVLGGSLGALKLNQLVPEVLASMSPELRPEVQHQTGRKHFEAARQAYSEAQVDGRVEPFVEDMAAAYGWADLVLCRAGALTVSEITAAGVAAYFVPYPYAIDDHQSRNANWLVSHGAAVMKQERELTAEVLRQDLVDLLSSREALLNMARKARELAMPRAAERVADVCLEVAHDR